MKIISVAVYFILIKDTYKEKNPDLIFLFMFRKIILAKHKIL